MNEKNVDAFIKPPIITGGRWSGIVRDVFEIKRPVFFRYFNIILIQRTETGI